MQTQQQETELAKATKVLREALKSDPELYYAYQANIAMPFVDQVRWCQERNGRKHLSKQDVHTVANDAAKQFLDLFIKD